MNELFGPYIVKAGTFREEIPASSTAKEAKRLIKAKIRSARTWLAARFTLYLVVFCLSMNFMYGFWIVAGVLAAYIGFSWALKSELNQYRLSEWKKTLATLETQISKTSPETDSQ
jgi:hypothetical protein